MHAERDATRNNTVREREKESKIPEEIFKDKLDQTECNITDNKWNTVDKPKSEKIAESEKENKCNYLKHNVGKEINKSFSHIDTADCVGGIKTWETTQSTPSKKTADCVPCLNCEKERNSDDSVNSNDSLVFQTLEIDDNFNLRGKKCKRKLEDTGEKTCDVSYKRWKFPDQDLSHSIGDVRKRQVDSKLVVESTAVLDLDSDTDQEKDTDDGSTDATEDAYQGSSYSLTLGSELTLNTQLHNNTGDESDSEKEIDVAENVSGAAQIYENTNFTLSSQSLTMNDELSLEL